MSKITYHDFITSETSRSALLHKLKEEITASYAGMPPAQISGHTLSQRRPGKVKGEDVFNKIHELFDPLMQIQSTYPNRMRLNRELAELSQGKTAFATERGDIGDNPNDAYIRVATEAVINAGGDYLPDYNVYRYAIAKKTLDDAWNSFKKTSQMTEIGVHAPHSPITKQFSRIAFAMKKIFC